MDTSPVLQSVKIALEAHDYQGKLFSKIGNNSNPKGAVTTAYRNAYRALKTAMTERNREQAVAEVLSQLKTAVAVGVRPVLQASIKYSQIYAEKQLSLFGEDVTPTTSIDLSTQVDNAMDAVIAGLDNQAARISSILIAGLDDSLIMGDANHVGLLRPSEIITSVNFWISTLLWSNFERTLKRKVDTKEIYFDKVAVAALDQHTTDCCLRVHGQVQPIDAPFHLDGFPRYADLMDWPPFHWHCRTSIALKRHDIDDLVIDDLKVSAEDLLQERAKGIAREIYPANAFLRKTKSK
jgi:hypothetical protein